jgi:uridine kinase
VITNPPWSQFAPWLRHALTLARGGVAFVCTINHVWTRHRRERIKAAGFGVQAIFEFDAPAEWGAKTGFQLGVVVLMRGYEVEIPPEQAPPNSILLFDGVFLLCPELRTYWDFSIFLDAPFDVTIRRCARRDGSPPDVNAPENRRYVEGQRLYFLECEPKRAATVLINNDDHITGDHRARIVG